MGNYAFINTPFEPDPMFLREMSYQEQLSLLKWNIGQKTVAVKCDLCYFRPEGPACVSACPHQALILVTEDGVGGGEAVTGEPLQHALFERMKEVAVVTTASDGPPRAETGLGREDPKGGR